MAWTAILSSIESVDPKQGKITWYVTYLNGGEKVQRGYTTPTLTDFMIAETARNEIDSLDRIGSTDPTKLSTKAGDTIDTTPPVVVPPVDPDPALTKFTADYRTYIGQQRALTLGFPVAKPITKLELSAEWDERFTSVLERFDLP